MDYYEILGVPRNASAVEIERGFRSVARKVHPDLHLGDGNADARMKQLNHIRDTLVDPLLRAAYDDRLRQEGAAPPAPSARSDGDPGASRFGTWGAPRPARRGPDTRPSEAAEPVPQWPPSASARAPARRRWLAALALILLPAAGVLVVRSARGRRVSTSPMAVLMPAPPAPRTLAPPFNEAKRATPVTPPGPVPTAVESRASAAPRPKRVAKARGGVVRIGSTSDDVLGAFGPPDRVENGPRPGDTTMIYGELRLALRNGRVITEAAPLGSRPAVAPGLAR